MRSSKANVSKYTPPLFWDFNDLTGWVDATQVGVPNYFIDNGYLNISTNANTWDRTKIKTVSTFTTGTYSWRVYVPAMGIGDMASIGAFLYNDDTHELDFEIGYGNQASRQELNAASDDLVVYMTSQANPFQSIKNKIKREQWHTLSIILTLDSKNKYIATWKIDGATQATRSLTYGTKSKFNIFCSLENLTFIGDHIPNSKNYALFDFVEFSSN
ncbi:hypothetical protein E0F76_01420 [Flavobacterium cellulosilyticum]|uniref:Uncharacterized protein n=2 Tax=Flavobacterium cellulosilyticum TaxID=2541731 RepID=A0A4R5CJ85_9FLAO|nr:hypothetical protein E0F76_01420 [Flavobacterium cellulosilyticum]